MDKDSSSLHLDITTKPTYRFKTGYSFYQAKDQIEDHLKRKIICECQILTDEKDLKRMRLQTAFGMDFGEPGRREMDVI